MSAIHFTMQGKGGVGKTFVAAILSQYFQAHLADGQKLKIIDTDPVNATLSQYKAFEVIRLDLQEKDSTRISERQFDQLMEMVLTESDTTFVVDNGAASFVPLSNYLIENNAIDMMLDTGREIWMHPVVTGGLGMDDTTSGLNTLSKEMPDEVKIVVWKNHYFGSLEKEGRPFEELPFFKKNSSRYHAIVDIPRQSNDTFGEDIKSMLQQKLTFDQATGSDAFGIMSRQRLKIIKTKLFQDLVQVF